MKKINLFLVALITIFLGLNIVSAATITKGDTQIKRGQDYEDHMYYKTLNINGNTVLAYCLSGLSTSAAATGTTCNISSTSLTTAQSQKMGYIIKNKAVANDTTNYWDVEMSIIKLYNGCSSSGLVCGSLENTITTNVNSYISEANNQTYVTSSLNAKISSTTLTFTKASDGKYYSQTLSVTGNDIDSVSNIQVTSGASIQGTYANFRIVVPESLLTKASTTITYSAKVKQKMKYDVNVYECGTGKQELVVDNSGQATATVTATGTIKLSTTVISKKSAVTEEELPGATLKILDSNKKEISCKIIEKDKNNNQTLKTLDKCSWVSGEESKTVIGLDAGKYYLQEVIAPEGYTLSDKMVEFEVKADGTTTNVEMVDELEVEVPDTLSSRSVLLITIAMIDIALGIGIVTYVKKNRIQE